MGLLKRPLAWLTLLFAYTAFLCAVLPYDFRYLPALGAVLPLAFLFVRKIPRNYKRLILLSCIAVACAVGLFAVYTDAYIARYERIYKNTTVHAVGTVLSQEKTSSYSASYLVRVRSADGEKTDFRVSLTTSSLTLSCGDTVEGDFTLTEIEEYNGLFPEKKNYYSKKVALYAECEELTVTKPEHIGFYALVQEWRDTLKAGLIYSLGRKKAGLAVALFLGDRSMLSSVLTRDFRLCGLSHLLAVSGLHFVLLIGWVDKFLQGLIPNLKWRFLFLSLFIFLYMMLCGMTGSVVRAGFMMMIANLSSLFGRKADTLTSLGVSLVIMLCISPAMMYSNGLQLSATAVLGILWFERLWKIFFPSQKQEGKKKKITSRLMGVAETFLLPVGVQMIMLPLLCLYFGAVSLIVPLASLAVTPFAEGILLLTPLYLLFRYVPFIGAFLGWIIKAASTCTEYLTGLFAGVSGISLPLRSAVGIVFVCGISVLCVAVLFVRKRKKIAVVFLCGAMFCVGIFGAGQIVSYATRERVQVVSVCYKKNDTILLRQGGKYCLIDISDGTYTQLYHAYSEVVRDGCTEIECLFLTHFHTKHIQTFRRLTEKLVVHSLCFPAPESEADTETANALRTVAEEKKITVYEYTRGAETPVTVGNVSVTVENTYLSRSSHPVIAVDIAVRGQGVRYLGTSWNEVADTLTVGRNIYIFGGHGPIYKQEYTLPVSSPALLIFRNTALDFLTDGATVPENCRIYRDGETVRVTFK